MSNLKIIYQDELVLLKRNQSEYIYARAKIKKCWINISTKTKDLEEAQLFAIKWHAELQFKEKYNIPIHEKSVNAVCDSFLKHMKDSHNYNDENIKDYGSTLERYIRPYFGEKAITQITPELLKAYSSWRNSYWTEGPGAKLKFIEYKRGGKLIRRPVPEAYRKAPKRLSLEEIVLRKLFNLAAERGWMQVAQIPVVKLDVDTKARREGYKKNRRPAFTLDEYRSISKRLRNGPVSEEEKLLSRIVPDEFFKMLSPMDVKDQYLCWYITLLFTTGLRPGREVDSIRWMDVEEYTLYEGGVVRTKLHLPHSKTEAAPVIVRPLGVKGLLRLKQAYMWEAQKLGLPNKKPKLEDRLFTLPDGSWLSSHYFSRKFEKVLVEMDLLKNRYQKKRTLYSCRHSFATWLLKGQKVDVFKLAILMRTSVIMISRHYGQVEPEDIAPLLD